MGVTLVEQWGPTPDWSDSEGVTGGEEGVVGSRDRFLLFSRNCAGTGKPTRAAAPGTSHEPSEIKLWTTWPGNSSF